MLFQRLYNWIKYKTLPPSFLFKNRLFLERDSKHRRIFSNFGLNFRSSKWSSYDTYNIKIKSRTLFVKYVFALIFVFFLLSVFYFYQKYYINLYFLNNLAFAFWIIIDSFDYYLSFVIWLAIGLISSLFNFVYSYFFFNNFSKKNAFSSNSDPITNQKLINTSETKLSSSKSDLNWLVYSWLTNGTAAQKSNVIESLFEANIGRYWWAHNYSFFPKLYNTLFNMNKLESSINFFSLNNKINQQFFLHNYFGLTFLSFVGGTDRGLKDFDLLFYFYTRSNQLESTFKDPRTGINSDIRQWGVSTDSNDNQEYSFLTKSKTGLFFLDSFNYNKLNSMFANFNEFWVINFYIKNQLNVSKWNRWLYRYSILHRKILKNSHKLTLTKRLISSGFYDNNLFDKNIWASEHFSKFSKENSFFNLLDSSYASLLNDSAFPLFLNKSSTFGSKPYTSKKKLLTLSFYEDSYFWFLKRFYFFNTLPTNIIKSKTTFAPNRTDFFSEDSLNSQYSLIFSYLLKLNIHLFSLAESKNLTNPESFFFKEPNESNSYFSKDVHPILAENDILSKDNLAVLFWISSISSSNTSNFYLKNLEKSRLSIYEPMRPTSFNPSSKFLENLNTFLFCSSFDTNRLFLKDLNYLALFY